MCFYVRVAGSVTSNLVRRLGTDLADWVVLCKRRLRHVANRLCTSPDQPYSRSPYLPNLAKGIEEKPWFCNIDRKRAEELVIAGGEGCFVVRPSPSHPLTLTVCHDSKTYNVPIRKREDGLIALGVRKFNERTFTEVEDIILFYATEELILFKGGETIGRVFLCNPIEKDWFKKKGKEQLSCSN